MGYWKKSVFNFNKFNAKVGFIHIVRTHKGRGEGSSQMHTIVYKGGGGVQDCLRTQNKNIWTIKSQNLSEYIESTYA